MIALTDETRGARLMRETRKRTLGSTEREPKQTGTPFRGEIGRFFSA
jgi:hypothetical protein